MHNLRPYELGALYWAITWGGDANLRHSLGMGKPLGYGSVTLSIADKSLSWCNPARSQDLDLEDCQKAFIDIMEAFKGKASWENSDTLKALKAMANPQTSWRQGQDLKYPSLSPNEFVKFKNNKKALLDPIQGMSGGFSPNSFAPNRGNTGRQERDGAGGAATSTKNESPKKKEPPKPPSPAEKLYEAIDNMKNKDLLKLLKKEAIDPQKVDPELRKKIAKKLERFRRDAQFRPFIKPWLE
ncbi:MAG TPA: hypothetical protein PLA80_13895 [Synergistaceae bacterium]|nr:hypothetical protein [Synergistaceae bacterium]